MEKPKPAASRLHLLPLACKVYVQIGTQKRLARIVEDRGTIGRGGRRLLRVTFSGGDDAVEQSFEIPAAEVTRARPSVRRAQTIKGKTAQARKRCGEANSQRIRHG